jgi:hypothetical protein
MPFIFVENKMSACIHLGPKKDRQIVLSFSYSGEHDAKLVQENMMLVGLVALDFRLVS